MNKPLCKNLQNIDRNETGKFGGSKCYWSGDFWLKTPFEKTAFKDMDWKIPYILQDATGEQGKKKPN